MPFDECFSKALKINKVRYPSVGWICHHLADSTRFRGDWQTVKYNLQMTVLVNQSNEHGSNLCSSEHYLSSSNNKAWKKFRPAWDLNPWPLQNRCSSNDTWRVQILITHPGYPGNLSPSPYPKGPTGGALRKSFAQLRNSVQYNWIKWIMPTLGRKKNYHCLFFRRTQYSIDT